MTRIFTCLIIVLLLNMVFNEQGFAKNKNKEITNLMAISRVNVDSLTSKVGDPFCAGVVENLNLDNAIVIPSGSILQGNVSKVKKAGRLNKYGSVTLTIDKVQKPDGQIISLKGKEIRLIVKSPYEKSIKERIAERIPISIVGSGTSIPLGHATDLNGGIVYAISTGAAALAGAVTGALDPDYHKTRAQTSLARSIESTPVGTIRMWALKGKEARLSAGDCINIALKNNTIVNLAKSQTNIAQY